jgi:hypothetical protein
MNIHPRPFMPRPKDPESWSSDTLCLMVENPPVTVDALDGYPCHVAMPFCKEGSLDGEPERLMATLEFRGAVIAYIDGPHPVLCRCVWNIENDHGWLLAAGLLRAWPHSRDHAVKIAPSVMPGE